MWPYLLHVLVDVVQLMLRRGLFPKYTTTLVSQVIVDNARHPKQIVLRAGQRMNKVSAV